VLRARSLRRGWETAWGIVLPLAAAGVVWLGGQHISLVLLSAVIVGWAYSVLARPREEKPPGRHVVVASASGAPSQQVWAQVRWTSSPRLPRIAPVVVTADEQGVQVRQVFGIACGDAPLQMRADGVPFEAELLWPEPPGFPLLRVAGADPLALREPRRQDGPELLSAPDFGDPPDPPDGAVEVIAQWWQRSRLDAARRLLASGPQWMVVHLVPAPSGFTTPWVVVRPSDGHVLARQYVPTGLSGANAPQTALLGVARGSAVLDEDEDGALVDGLLHGRDWSHAVLLRGVRVRRLR
jgi:hypothetical protein